MRFYIETAAHRVTTSQVAAFLAGVAIMHDGLRVLADDTEGSGMYDDPLRPYLDVISTARPAFPFPAILPRDPMSWLAAMGDRLDSRQRFRFDRRDPTWPLGPDTPARFGIILLAALSADSGPGLISVRAGSIEAEIEKALGAAGDMLRSIIDRLVRSAATATRDFGVSVGEGVNGRDPVDEVLDEGAFSRDAPSGRAARGLVKVGGVVITEALGSLGARSVQFEDRGS